ncbi:radical SAM protein [Candidatus Pelagibacter sp. Uisw_099_02]|uniref:radical SAM protein n=1 Tax=Candidatus Pelagibacter sp. Uisw_099_02 TaxID=3230981 RepID=UPI0039ED5B4D|tara:strand:- start:3698 stop:4831 length:1134 start_codon:yes stop_codon:yes gene_type:complete
MYPNKEFKNFLSFFKNSPGRLVKYIELLTLKNKSNTLATTDRKSLNEVCIVINTKCNLKCVWCHREEKHIQDSGYLERNGDLEKLKKLLPKLDGFNCVHWGGLAEPLLNKDIFELTKLARQYVPRVKVTTNGTTLVPKVIKKIIESGMTDIEISLDGFDGETNMKYRGSDESKVISYLENLSSQSDIPLQINSVITDVNIHSLWEAIDKLKNVKTLKSIHTIPLFVTKHLTKLGIGPADPKEHKKLLEHWRKRIDFFGLDIKLSPDIEDVTLDPIVSMKRMHNICYTVYEHPFINLDGNISPCGRLQHISLDNINDLGFDEAWNGPKIRKWREEQLHGNFGTYCQRECHMKNTCPSRLNNLNQFMGKFDDKMVVIDK